MVRKGGDGVFEGDWYHNVHHDQSWQDINSF